MDDKYLKQILTKRAQQEITDTMDIREKIFQRLNVSRFPAQPRRLHFGWRAATLVAAVLMVSTGVVYALRQSRVQPDPGIQTMQAENQVVQLDAAQSLEAPEPLTSLNVMLDYAYADSNRITVAYRVSGTAGVGADLRIFTNPTLTDSGGNAYVWLPTSGQWTTENQPGEQEGFAHSGIMSFDSGRITDNVAALDLKLQIEVGYSTAEIRAEEPHSMFMAGAASFSFQVPFNPGRILAVTQSASAGDLTIKLQKVVIAPSLTRLDLCLSNPAVLALSAWPEWETPVTVEVGDQRVVSDLPSGFTGLNGSPLTPEAPCRALAIPASLNRHSGPWTVTLNGFINRASGERVPGTWVFSFDVP